MVTFSKNFISYKGYNALSNCEEINLTKEEVWYVTVGKIILAHDHVSFLCKSKSKDTLWCNDLNHVAMKKILFKRHSLEILHMLVVFFFKMPTNIKSEFETEGYIKCINVLDQAKSRSLQDNFNFLEKDSGMFVMIN